MELSLRMAEYFSHATKPHLLILKQKPKSTDTYLQSLICDLKKHLVPIENLKGANDIIEHAIQSTVIYVAERLLEQECLLLPAVKQKYSSIMSTLTCRQNQHVEDTITARWILSNLVVCL